MDDLICDVIIYCACKLRYWKMSVTVIKKHLKKDKRGDQINSLLSESADQIKNADITDIYFTDIVSSRRTAIALIESRRA